MDVVRLKFYIYTLGCKVNTYESEVIKEKLIKKGFIYSDYIESEMVIINTCSVTNMADNKSKKIVRRSKRDKKITIVCGCSAENKQEEYKNIGVNILIGNKDKSKIDELILEYVKEQKNITRFYNDNLYEFEDMEISRFSSHTRAFIKIQDGCSNYCSYCIIPYTRKNPRCKDFDKVIKEAKNLVENGHKEIVLTGIHTGSYINNGKNLKDVLSALEKIEGLKRIRLSSIEITELSEDMLDEIKNNKKLVNHFHIPLQNGSDEILKIMNRKYNLEYFENILNKIRNIKPDVSITTDVIVGHPYETDELFLKTLETCKNYNFAKIHVFPYSKRDGTKSSEMPDIDDITKKGRSKQLNELSKSLEKKYYKDHINKNLEVLIEKVYDDYSIGFSSNYIKVRVNKTLNKNEIYNVKIINYKDGYLLGEVIII